MPLSDDYLREERIKRLRARIASGTKQLVILGDAIPEYLRLGSPRADDTASPFKAGRFALSPDRQRDHDIALGMFIAERQHGIYSNVTRWFNETDNESPRNLNDALFLRYRALPPAASLVVRDVAKRENGAQDQIALLISGIEARIQIFAGQLEFDGQFDNIAPSLRDATGGWPHLRSSGWIAGPVLDGYLARMRRRRTQADIGASIGAAKEVTEATLKGILAANPSVAVTKSKADLHELWRAVRPMLVDSSVDPALGAKDGAILKLASAEVATIQNLGELRNKVGSGHGKPLHPDGLRSSHALFAVDTAHTLTRFLANAIVTD